ncbi:MAG TPA: hypothetical protein VF040_15590 [Ktedonobacterales bacterium]
MRHTKRWAWAGVTLLFACLLLTACAQPTSSAEGDTKPATVEPIPGTDLSKVILTVDAAKRIGIQTIQMKGQAVNGATRTVIPYSALLYDVTGLAWVYTNPATLTYVRAQVVVENITGDQVVLKNGPPSGTTIVTVGAPELYGTEIGVGDEA